MMCVISVRRITPGSYDDFRRAVVPDPWPERLVRLEISRNAEDPDEVCTIGYMDMSADELDELRDDPAFLQAETERLQRIAAFEEMVLVSSLYELADDIVRPGRG